MGGKRAVTVNIRDKVWRSFQRFCEGNAIGYSYGAETALIDMMRRARCWRPQPDNPSESEEARNAGVTE